MLRSILLGLAIVAASPAHAFSIEFDWSGLKSCTTGRPNTVGSPAFRMADLPAGTQSVVFKLVDTDVRSFRHGGGKVNLSQSGKLPGGLFTYLSPCPPNGSHTYEWTATAKSAANGKGDTLGIATARRRYPE